jgi:hypothetical protein
MELWLSTFEKTLPGLFPELFLFLSLSVVLIFGAFATEKGSNSKFPVIIARPIAQVRVLMREHAWRRRQCDGSSYDSLGRLAHDFKHPGKRHSRWLQEP